MSQATAVLSRAPYGSTACSLDLNRIIIPTFNCTCVLQVVVDVVTYILVVLWTMPISMDSSSSDDDEFQARLHDVVMGEAMI